jgi:hypothetical protein
MLSSSQFLQFFGAELDQPLVNPSERLRRGHRIAPSSAAVLPALDNFGAAARLIGSQSRLHVIDAVVDLSRVRSHVVARIENLEFPTPAVRNRLVDGRRIAFNELSKERGSAPGNPGSKPGKKTWS